MWATGVPEFFFPMNNFTPPPQIYACDGGLLVALIDVLHSTLVTTVIEDETLETNSLRKLHSKVSTAADNDSDVICNHRNSPFISD